MFDTQDRITFKTLCDHQPGLQKEVEKFINELPQAEAIKSEDAQRWLDKTAGLNTLSGKKDLNESINQMWWHLKRLQGIGGSDIGSVICFRVGETPDFNTPDDIFRQKRMMDAPTNGTNYTRRGHKLEPFIAELLLEDYELERDQDLIDTVYANSGKVPGYEFLVGNIDDGMKSADGQRIITDYKAPSETPDTNPFGYEAQLHAYDIILNNGEPGDNAMMDVYFNYAKFELTIHECERNPELTESIKQYGSEFWDIVKDPSFQQLPEVWMTNTRIIETDIELTEEQQALALEHDKKLKVFKVLSEQVDLVKKELSQLSEQLVTSGFGLKKDLKKAIPDLTVRQYLKVKDPLKLEELLVRNHQNIGQFQKTSKDFDNKQVEELIEQAGLAVDGFKKKEFDPDLVYEYLSKKGVEPGEYLSHSVAVYPTGNKKTVKAEVAQIREHVIPVMEGFFEDALMAGREVQNQPGQEIQQNEMNQ